LLSTSYKIVSNIRPSGLIPYANEINGDHQRGFRRNRSGTDFAHLSDTGQNWEYTRNGTVHQLFTDFNEDYDSVRRKVLYNILIEF
jgi:hypothetical protein